jgi:hypothetical protein
MARARATASVPGLSKAVQRALRSARMSRFDQLRGRIGSELGDALLRVVELQRQDWHNNREARRKLAQLRAYMGWYHWGILMRICERGTLTTGMHGKPGLSAAIVDATDALVMIVEWEEESKAWGL